MFAFSLLDITQNSNNLTNLLFLATEPFNLTDYLQLVDWSGRIFREDKKGHIPDHLPDILQRLNIDPKHFIYLSQHFESPF
jgi:hypothetical protein